MAGEFRGVSCVTSLHQSVAHLRGRGKPCREESRIKRRPQRFLVATITFVKARRKFQRQKTSSSSSNEIKVTIILVVSCLNKHNLVTSSTHERFVLPWFSDFHKLQSASAFTPIAVTYCVERIFLFLLLHRFLYVRLMKKVRMKCDHHHQHHPYPRECTQF